MASVPTSAKLYQVMPLNEDLQNELDGATLEEPVMQGQGDHSHYILHFYQSTGAHIPKLVALKDSDSKSQLYDANLNCWQPSFLPHILCFSAATHGVGCGCRNSIRTLDSALPSTSTQCHRSTQQNITVMRTVQASDTVLVTETEEGTYLPKSGSEENKMATWLNHIALSLRSILKPQTSGPQMRAKTKELADIKCTWSSEFAMRPIPADLDMKMKPNITLLQKDLFDPQGKNLWRDIVSFLELSSSNDFSRLARQLTRKAYTIFVVQPGHHFVVALSILHSNFHLHLFNRSGAIHSCGYSIHCHADYFVHVLYMLTFGAPELISYDPTLFFSPIIARIPCTCVPPTIYISNDLYNIICLLFSSDLIHGRATLCFIIMKAPTKWDKWDRNGKQYVMKSSWACIG